VSQIVIQELDLPDDEKQDSSIFDLLCGIRHDSERSLGR